jgi:hypothetical protein
MGMVSLYSLSSEVFQPTNAVRGGIRGIIELEYLHTLETALNRRNGRLRIQSFFDLVIGTRSVLTRL